ncbi:hypothetical protein [Actinomyces sp. ZJ308]|uniref:LppM family (lipo)protein n=1 Tax=Actinomyces sp. ZJ308 TaxID=2708342 RepID=UPI001422873A|nr:hypothetical protein [Actinomyces sp. ZJ308]
MAATTPLRRTLSALAFLPLLASLTLVSPTGNALTSTAKDQDSRGAFTIAVTINKDDTYDYKMSVTRNKKDSSTSSDDLKKSCEGSSGSGAWDKAKATYSEPEGRPTCTYSGKDKISESSELIEHVGDEYVFDTGRGAVSSADDDMDYTLSVTFPGNVTNSDGGKVSGTTVTFHEAGDYRVTGKDTPAFPWVWLIIGVLVVAAAGGGAFWYLNNRKKMAQQQTYQAYPAGAAGYATGQPQAPAPGQAQAPGSVPPPPQGAVDPGYAQQEHGGAANPGPVPPPADNRPDAPTSY